MLENIPYKTIKEDARAYRVMLLCDQHGLTPGEAARAEGLPAARATDRYLRIKSDQVRLYIHQIARALGHEDTASIERVYHEAYGCYRDIACACAYMEQKYEAILTPYRAGEPGMPDAFVKSLPPYSPTLPLEMITQIIRMHETEKMPFAAIAASLDLTQARAKHEYSMAYHESATGLLRRLEASEASPTQKRAIRDAYMTGNASTKRRYEQLRQALYALDKDGCSVR